MVAVRSTMTLPSRSGGSPTAQHRVATTSVVLESTGQGHAQWCRYGITNGHLRRGNLDARMLRSHGGTCSGNRQDPQPPAVKAEGQVIRWNGTAWENLGLIPTVHRSAVLRIRRR